MNINTAKAIRYRRRMRLKRTIEFIGNAFSALVLTAGLVMTAAMMQLLR